MILDKELKEVEKAPFVAYKFKNNGGYYNNYYERCYEVEVIEGLEPLWSEFRILNGFRIELDLFSRNDESGALYFLSPYLVLNNVLESEINEDEEYDDWREIVLEKILSLKKIKNEVDSIRMRREDKKKLRRSSKKVISQELREWLD